MAAELAAVEPAGMAGAQRRHDGSDGAGSLGRRDLPDHALERGGIERRGRVRLEDGVLAPVLGHQLSAPTAGGELLRLLALADLPTDELHEVRLGELAAAPLHLEVFRGRQEPPQHVNPGHVPRLHGAGEILRQLPLREPHVVLLA